MIRYFKSGYARSYKELEEWYKPVTFAEARNLPHLSLVYCPDKNGGIRQVVVTSVQSWKRKWPGVYLNLRYGLRDFFSVGSKYQEDQSLPIGEVYKPFDCPLAADTPSEIVKEWYEERMCHVTH